MQQAYMDSPGRRGRPRARPREDWAVALLCNDADARKRCAAGRQVEKHASRESAWFVHSGLVYDATKFLAEHPGGAESILIVAGQVRALLCFAWLGFLCVFKPPVRGCTLPVPVHWLV